VRNCEIKAFSGAQPRRAWLVSAILRLFKLTLECASHTLVPMTDSAPSDRSRFYSVAELANEFSLTSQGIRFYEESGLIAPARVGRTRVFNYQDRARLVLIQRLRRLGFSIDAIREYLSLYKADATGAAQYRLGLERITERIRELEGKRRDLDETLAGLRALELDAKERLDRALTEEAKRPRHKNTNVKGDVR
jgi:DNA-binding transcriptional MerR regulator